MFRDRTEAAKLLAEKLLKYKNTNGIVLSIPRGGVVLGYEIANELNLPLEIMVTKKIGHPYNREFSIGSVSLFGIVLNKNIPVPPEYLNEEIKDAIEILQRKYRMYNSRREQIDFNDKIVIITDDGIATGNTIIAIIEIIKRSNPAKMVIAVPVTSPRIVEELQKRVDEVVCLIAPEDFMAVGQFYENFDQVSDDEVIYLLKEANKLRKDVHHAK